MDQVADRFYAAVRTLAGDGPLKQRLIGAYVGHLESIAEDEVPEAIRTRFEALRAAMAAVPPTEKETAVQVSVRKMSPAEAARLVRSVIAMFAELVRVKGTGERLGAGDGPLAAFGRSPESGIRVPEFLARSAG
ncbi:MAG: hypothetical protein J0M16_00975 [Gammaproteobacteria bacterium]|nr:hypothetical protein [Gammaproteobacteria bacterium]